MRQIAEIRKERVVLPGVMAARRIGISQTITINGEAVFSVSAYPKTALYDKYGDSEEERNRTFAYTGRHDHGQLPKLKVAGDIALILTAMKETRAKSGAFLTSKLVEAGQSVDDKEESIEDEMQEDSDQEEDEVEQSTTRKKQRTKR